MTRSDLSVAANVLAMLTTVFQGESQLEKPT